MAKRLFALFAAAVVMAALVPTQLKADINPGAAFWVYVSPQNDTTDKVTKWVVTITSINGAWSGEITSYDPRKILQTPGLSGVFKVNVVASGPKMPQKRLNV